MALLAALQNTLAFGYTFSSKICHKTRYTTKKGAFHAKTRLLLFLRENGAERHRYNRCLDYKEC